MLRQMTMLRNDPGMAVRNTLPQLRRGFNRPATFAARRDLADIAPSIDIRLLSEKLFRSHPNKSGQFFDQLRKIELLICTGIISISFHQNQNVFRKLAVPDRPTRIRFKPNPLMATEIEFPNSISPLRIACLIVANDRVRTFPGSEIVHATEL